MKLGKDWKIESDEANVTVFKRHSVKDRETGKNKFVWKAEAYLSNVNNAVRWFINHKINETGLKDLKHVQSEIERLEGILNEAKLKWGEDE